MKLEVHIKRVAEDSYTVSMPGRDLVEMSGKSLFAWLNNRRLMDSNSLDVLKSLHTDGEAEVWIEDGLAEESDVNS